MKLEKPIPICLDCEVCLISTELEQDHREILGHRVEMSDCLHPFLKGITDRISPMLWCICDCDKCKRGKGDAHKVE